MASKKKDKEKKENKAKMKEKQKKLKEMRYHQVQSTPFVQPAVDQALLAAAISQAQAMGGAAVNPVFVNPVGTSTGFNLNHLLNPLHMRLRGSVMKVGRYLRELGMPPLTLQEEGLTKGTSCPSDCPMSGAS